MARRGRWLVWSIPGSILGAACGGSAFTASSDDAAAGAGAQAGSAGGSRAGDGGRGGEPHGGSGGEAPGGSAGLGGEAPGGAAGATSVGGEAGVAAGAGSGGVAAAAGTAGIAAGGGTTEAGVVDASADAGGDAGCTAPAPVPGCTGEQYWNPCTATCAPCSDFGWISFGDPVLEMSLSGGFGGTDQLFARTQSDGSQSRAVVRQTASGDQQIVALSQSGGAWGNATTNLGGGVNQPSSDESGPLLFPPGASVPGVAVPAGYALLLFDSDRNGSRHIFASPLFWSGTSPPLLGNPVNGGERDYSVAVAWVGAQRFWWSSFRDVGGQDVGGLFTWSPADVAAEHVPVALEGGCLAEDEDLEPWVSPDGTLLLFSATRRQAPSCDAVDGARTLYHVRLDASGRPMGPAREIPRLRMALEQQYQRSGFHLQTPSLGPAFCTLFFSSNADLASVPDYDVFSAARE